MRLYNHRDEIRAKTRGSAHLGITGALKELSAPREEKSEELTDEQVVELVRAFMEMEGPTELSDIEQAALERRLAKPGERERDLLSGIQFEHMMMYGCQVAQDGFIIDVRDGQDVVEWRSPDKKKLYRFAAPEPGTSKLPESERERVKRGAKVYGVLTFQVWRLLSNWFTEVLVAAEVDDLEKVEHRITHNADWKRAELAGEFLRDKLIHEGIGEERKLDMKKWALRHQAPGLGEFEEMVGGVKLWVDLRARSLEHGLMGTEENGNKVAD
jgi:hypothetical protein